MKIGICVLATNAYFVLGIRFIKRFMRFYKGDKEIVFYLFTDTDPKDYLPEGINCEFIYTKNSGWVEGVNLKFSSILKLGSRGVDYLFFFDADTNIYRSFTEEWFLGESVAGQHFGDQSWMKHEKSYDRNPRSTAYVPIDTTLPQMYFYGAFWGGSKDWTLSFCRTMLEWQKANREWGYEPPVNDESYSNKFFHFNPPSRVVMCPDFKFVISDKGSIDNMRGGGKNIEEIRRRLLEWKNEPINIVEGRAIRD